jgi:hypothetical protein
MIAQTFSDLPPIRTDAVVVENPLKGVLVTVFTLKIIVTVFLLGTVSLAPPVAADETYKTLAFAD